MPSPVSQRYERLAATFADRVAAVSNDRWSSESPCEGWTARDVVGHVVDSHSLFLGLVGRSLPSSAPTVDDDPVAGFDAARSEMQGSLDDSAVANTEYDGAFGPTRFADGVDAFLCFDLAVHGWDLARAAGLPAHIDPAEVARVRRVAESFGDALRGPGWFGPEVEPPPGADEQARLLAFLGRDPT